MNFIRLKLTTKSGLRPLERSWSKRPMVMRPMKDRRGHCVRMCSTRLLVSAIEHPLLSVEDAEVNGECESD